MAVTIGGVLLASRRKRSNLSCRCNATSGTAIRRKDNFSDGAITVAVPVRTS